MISLCRREQVRGSPGAGYGECRGCGLCPTALVYTPYRTVKEYLTMAGGTTEIADDKEIYVIKTNGAAVSRKGFSLLRASWDGSKYGYHPGGISPLTPRPGDTMVVPEN